MNDGASAKVTQLKRGATITHKFQSDGFIVVRSPLFKLSDLIDWNNSSTCAQAIRNGENPDAVHLSWDSDVRELRDRLAAKISDPIVQKAIFLASPSLIDSLRYWLKDPFSKKGLQAERALVRYVERMSTRATPFGLFSGISLGYIRESETCASLEAAPQAEYRSVTRLDFNVIFALDHKIRADGAVLRQLRYGVNPTAYALKREIRYVEAERKQESVAHRFVSVERDKYLDHVLRVAKSSPLFETLASSLAFYLVHQDRELQNQEATDIATHYIHELIESDLLLPETTPSATGDDPLKQMLAPLSNNPSSSELYSTLTSVRDLLKQADADLFAPSIDILKSVQAKLAGQLSSVNISRLLQVDLFKPGKDMRISENTAERVLTVLELMAKSAIPAESNDLRVFKDSFRERYDRAWIPLSEALDPDIGIGFGSTVLSDGSPLVRGVALHSRGPGGPPSESISSTILNKVVEAIVNKDREVILGPDDFEGNGSFEDLFPDSFSAFITLVPGRNGSLEPNDIEIILRNASGPSGVRMLARFCHMDPELHNQVIRSIRKEEALQPDCVFAEIVYLPEGRLGNVLSRPVLREYEIVCAGKSGAAKNKQLPLSDLLVGLRGNQIVLFSRKLGVRVIPRLSTAHGYMNQRLPAVYRFLCQLQNAEGRYVPTFNWGALRTLAFLPRVKVDNVIVSLAQWVIPADDLKSLAGVTRAAAFVRIQAIRSKLDLPRFVVLVEGDNQLTSDLDNPLSVDALCHALRRASGSVLLREHYPSLRALADADHNFPLENELVIPYTRRKQESHEDIDSGGETTLSRHREGNLYPSRLWRIRNRKNVPGSGWHYLKVYGGPTILDEITRTVFLPLLTEMKNADDSMTWFFLRYADPHPHLRIRMKTSNRMDEQLNRLLTPFVATDKVWRIQIDTYVREIERYGGVSGIRLAEQFFTYDSNAAAHALSAISSLDQTLRWQTTLWGMDALLDLLLDSAEGKRLFVRRQSDGLGKMLQLDRLGQRQVADRCRSVLPDASAVWSGAVVNGLPQTVRAAYDRRSKEFKIMLARLQRLATKKKLYASIEDIVGSHLHMHVNRMMPSSQQTHELIFYELLYRRYSAQAFQVKSDSFSSSEPGAYRGNM